MTTPRIRHNTRGLRTGLAGVTGNGEHLQKRLGVSGLCGLMHITAAAAALRLSTSIRCDSNGGGELIFAGGLYRGAVPGCSHVEEEAAVDHVCMHWF